MVISIRSLCRDMENTEAIHQDYVMEIAQRAISSESIKNRRCFTCGGEPSSGQGEHVIPKWLQKKYGLHDQKLTLLNGTLIPYRQLTVPCCEKCNNGFLSGIEKQVQTIQDKGDVTTLDEYIALGRWMAKILVGILVKETSLLRDRRYPDLGRIVPSDFLEELHHCQLILQSARKATMFRCLHGPHPFTLYWYKINEGEHPKFDLSTNIVGQSIAIRAGGLAVVFVNDGGLQLNASEKGPYNLQGHTMAPHQFSELAARVHYKSGLRDATHFYINSETPSLLTIEQSTVRPYTSTILAGGEMQVFEPWDDKAFAHVASIVTPFNASTFFDEGTGAAKTTLGNLLSPEMVE